MSNTLLYEQLQQICCMIAAGSIFFALLDLVNEFGRLAKWKKIHHIIAECITVILLGLYLCIFLIVRYHGLLRMYVVFALMLGVILYTKLLRKYCIPVHCLIAKGFLWLYGKTVTILIMPWRMLYSHVIGRVKKYIKKIKQHRQEVKLEEMEEADYLEEII